jgi:hypothetical protein
MKAISLIIVILLVACSAIVGGLISYLWVMSSYYNMPEDTVMLIVEDLNFSPTNFTHFNLTLLNPSNSVLDVNLTSLRINLEGKNDTQIVTTTEPALPIVIKRGTRQSFKCLRNWSNISGEVVRIEPVGEVNSTEVLYASTRSFPYVTPTAKLGMKASFDDTKSVQSFNLSINSYGSGVNLTVSEIRVFGVAVNVTPSLSEAGLFPPEIAYRFFEVSKNWEGWRGQNVTLSLETVEGYDTSYTTDKVPGASLYVDKVNFDYTDTSYFNVTVASSEDSTANGILSAVNLTLADNTTIPLNTIPPFDVVPIAVAPNQSVTVKCLWDWNTHRNETVTVTAFTNQSFTVSNKTAKIPSAVVWNITEAKFDLDDTQNFTAKIANTPCSQSNITVTRIQVNSQNVTLDPPSQVVNNGSDVTFVCGLNWTNLRGQNVTVTAFTDTGLNVSLSVSLPSTQLKVLEDSLVFGDLADANVTTTIPYINVTVLNSANSVMNLTVTKITLQTSNKTFEIDGTITYPAFAPSGYNLTTGQNVTLVCLWNWELYLTTNEVKVTVYTAEGYQATKTWRP